jgi:isopentenyl phosphate kinase
MLTLLKLGGSLITDKTRPYTPRLEILDNLAGQIASALHENEDLRLVLGHGSGSFGHQPASQFGTRHGVAGPEAWHGFTEVWFQASALNRQVVEALRRASLPVITLSPAASVTAHEGKVFIWDLYPLQTSLYQRLLPVIHGDVVFDEARGGTILSTEDLFAHLARELRPSRILLAGLEAGVWDDFPKRKILIPEITPADLSSLAPNLGKADGTDVTGGMLTKVAEMLALVDLLPDLEILIFSGQEPGNIKKALLGANPGTRLHR